MIKRRILALLNKKAPRLFLGIALLALIVNSDYVSIDDLKLDQVNPLWIVISFALICGQIFLATLRWQILLKGIEVSIDYSTLLRLTWIGQFYSTFALGTVGSDLSKTALVFNKFKEKKKRISLTIFIDRFLGLASLLIIGLFAIIYAPNELYSRLDDKGAYLAFVILLIFSALGAFVFLKRDHLANKIPIFSTFREDFIRKRFLKRIFQNFFLAMMSQLGMVFIFWFIMVSLGTDLNLPNFRAQLWLAPVYLLATFLPLTPSGIGVGQAALAYLFSMSGIGSAGMGAAIASVFQILGILSNSLGIFAVLEKSSYSRQSIFGEDNKTT